MRYHIYEVKFNAMTVLKREKKKRKWERKKLYSAGLRLDVYKPVSFKHRMTEFNT